MCSIFRHSFGYDSGRGANLQLLDERTLVFIAGNILVLLDVETKLHKYIRSCSGGGIGCVTVRDGTQGYSRISHVVFVTVVAN